MTKKLYKLAGLTAVAANGLLCIADVLLLLLLLLLLLSIITLCLEQEVVG